ncbi:hypothetical protein K1W54_29860 [Micromonospora sp. CPCC 205371]|nr:hypothetical protein [Micromonospora sp. CPCC 205371]
MPDPSTPPYSAETVALVARALHVRHCMYCTNDTWEQCIGRKSKWQHTSARDVLDALAAAGLLATDTEYGIDTGGYLLRYDTRAEAEGRLARRAAVAEYDHPGTLICRPVGPWSPVPPEPGVAPNLLPASPSYGSKPVPPEPKEGTGA